MTAVRARLPGVFLCEAQVPEALSEQWYKLTQAKEAAGLVRLNRHKFISKVHAEQVMSEEFHARQNCGDRWLKLETREGLWRGQLSAGSGSGSVEGGQGKECAVSGCPGGRAALWGCGCGMGCCAASSDSENAQARRAGCAG